MSKLLWKALLVAPAALGAAVAVSGTALAAESAPVNTVDGLQSTAVKSAPVQLAQVTNVSELTDVKPSDWAFQALQGLVQNYGCLQGYPDRTFRGSSSLTRYEFAAGLNSCLDVVAVLISQSAINPDDLAAIRRLQEEFQSELAILRGRVETLEATTAKLEAQQFSTTTKLRGQVDMHLVTPIDVLDNTNSKETSTSVEARARLNFDTSFTGRDRLRIRLQSTTGANALAGFAGLANSSGVGNSVSYGVIVDDFYYRFPVSNSLTVAVAAKGFSGNDWVSSTILPYDGPAVADASGAQFYDFGGSSSNGAGVGLNFSFSDSVVLDLGYTAGYGGASAPNVGIFAASNQSYIAQLNFIPKGGFLNAAVAYLHNDRSAQFAAAGPTDTFAGLVSFNFDKFFLAGHGAYTTFTGGSGNDFSWTVGAGVSDFGLTGSKLGVYGGQLPQVSGRTDNPFLVEGYYEIPFSKYLTVTPAVIYGDAKYSTGGSDTAGIWGALRATFKF
ncbi:MAG: carbohydrate porin [Cyanobacteria bacterium REEB459]|nr:carbohydrate porin [Cyanobacteria bacterium REEB459]